MKSLLFTTLLLVGGLSTAIASDTAPDFERDVQPIFKKHCYECHGPDKQRNGYRLDRRSRAFKGQIRNNISPHSSESSRLYRRLIDSQFGPQMPPEDVLAAEEVDTIRRWIDAGAHWPDALANEADLPAPDARAIELAGLIRASTRDAQSRRRALALVRDEPASVNARGENGTTAVMEAALYADARLLKALLDAGGDPNRRNDRNSSALLWAVDDPRKVRLLLDAGANPNAASDFGQTPLTQAAAAAGSLPVVKLLVARGAEVTQPALNWAARDNPEVLRFLLTRLPDKGDAALTALRTGCQKCFSLFPDTVVMPRSLLALLPVGGQGDERLLRIALAHQADVNAKDAKRRTPLMMAAVSEIAPPGVIAELLNRGADVHATSAEGLNALDYAHRLGRPPLIDALAATGIKPTAAPTLAKPRYVADNDARSAIARSVPLLQSSSQVFYDKGGCVSCHHNLLGIMTTRTLRRQGLPFDTQLEAREIRTLLDDMATTRDQALQGIVVPGGLYTTTGYILLSLELAGHAPDATTDSLVRLLRRSQMRDGTWISAVRPPSESSVITAVAVSLRGLEAYGNRHDPADRVAIARSMNWLRHARSLNNEDRTFRLLGLLWGGAPAREIRAAADELLATQRADGGWAQLDYRESDAYATGQALVALHEAGVSADAPAYRRGARYLLNTQLVDGSWWVRTRSHFTQHYFESGFPHGIDQFISAAATNWATQALAWTIAPSSGQDAL